MLRNYLLVAIRSLYRQKLYTAINVFGLAAGLGICMLIVSFVLNELSFEDCHRRKDDIYRVVGRLGYADATIPMSSLMPPAGPALKNEFPEVREVARIHRISQARIDIGDQSFTESQALLAEPALFDVFTIALADGTTPAALEAPYNVLISRSLSRKYFGSRDPVGQTLKMLEGTEFQVAGTFEDMPANTQLRCDIIGSYSTLVRVYGEERNSWTNLMQDHTYLLLHPDADPEALEARLPIFVDRHIGGEHDIDFKMWLQPLSDIYLYSDLSDELHPDGNPEMLIIFGIIAGLVLLVACCNFVNLATARTMHRIKEVGVRKVLGATRATVARQFLGEALLVVLVATILGLVIFELCLPWLEAFVEHPLAASVYSSPAVAVSAILMTLIVGLAAGFYPALYLAGFSPKAILGRWRVGGGRKSMLRRVLVTAQFAAGVVLAVGTIVIHNQVDFCRTTDLGFDRDDILVVDPIEALDADALRALKQRITTIAGVESASLVAFSPGTHTSWSTAIKDPSRPDDPGQLVMLQGGDHDFLRTFGIELLQGQGLPEVWAGGNQPILINETAVENFDLIDPVGYVFESENQQLEVVGVISDFHLRPLHNRILPMIVKQNDAVFGALAVRLSPGDRRATVAAIDAAWSDLHPEQPINRFHVDDKIDAVYGNEERQASLVMLFAGLVGLIAGLGVLGLSAYMAERRSREISIRRVLGSTTLGIVRLLSREFLILIVLANVIGAPVAYFAAQAWLERFAYQVGIGPGPFLATVLGTILLAMATVFVQTLRVARANPADILRCE